MSAEDALIAQPQAYTFGERADALFAQAMQSNFAHHYRGCPDYARYCDMVGVRPADGRGYEDIPYVFVANFKRRQFITGPRKNIRLTLTSSGTAGEKSCIYLDATSLRRITDIVHHIYAAFGMTSDQTTNYLCFTYDPRKAKDLGTAFSDKLLTGLTRVGRVHYAIRWDTKTGSFQLDRERCFRALENFAKAAQPFRVLGFPALIWDVLGEYAATRERRFSFGDQSYVITGGGWKGQADREIPKAEFRAHVAEWLGIPEINVRDLYGMVEHGVPYCECEHFGMHVPIYSRVLVRDAATLEVLPPGRVGLFHMYTPYLHSFPALSLLTSDLGYIRDHCPCGRNAPRLEIVGRGGVTKHKGCAIAALDVLAS